LYVSFKSYHMATSPNVIREASILDSSVRRPKYQLIRDQLYGEIHSGRCLPGQSLPTEAKLAETLGMSRQTVRQALGQLEDEGLIERIQGRGTFVTTPQQRQARQQLDAYVLIAPQLREGFYPSLVAGFERSCSEGHHQVVVGNSENDLSRQGDLILQMIDKRIGGVALVPVTIAPTPVHHIRQLHEHHVPVVYCHRTVPGVSAPCVTWSGEEVGKEVGSALVRLQHRRVGALFGYEDDMVRSYLRGLRVVLHENGIELPARWVRYYGRNLPGPESLDLIRSNLHEMLCDAERPTAIFCGNQTDAEQVYLLAPELGMRIPRDLSVIHFGGTWRNGPLAQRLACVAVDEHELGVRASQLLSEMRDGNRPLNSDKCVLLPVSLLPGDTLASAPAI
jgi:DNA-binding LacI/PurR family transcriptional regulator